MAHPGNAVAAGILEYSYLLVSIYKYMVVTHPVSLDCTIYLLGVGVFAIDVEVSHLIDTCIYVHYLILGHNTSFPHKKRNKIHAQKINMHDSESSFSIWCIGKTKRN